MSGHNKWSKIKHKKAATDAQKSKIFGKVARLISVESKKADGDTSASGLRAAIDKAHSVNMPKDNIERAIAKGTSADGATLDPAVYETYGPGGVAIIIDALTDNKNRTAAEIKHLLSKIGLELASPGSALWAFENTAEGYEPKTMTKISDGDGEKLEKILETIDEQEDVQDVYTNAE